MPRLLFILLLLLGLLSGTGVGLYLSETSIAAGQSKTGNTELFSSASIADATAGQDRITTNTALAKKVRELEKELAEGRERKAASAEDRLAFFKRHHGALYFRPFDGTKLTPEMVEILSLSKQEEEAVEQQSPPWPTRRYRCGDAQASRR